MSYQEKYQVAAKWAGKIPAEALADIEKLENTLRIKDFGLQLIAKSLDLASEGKQDEATALIDASHSVMSAIMGGMEKS